MHQSPPTRPTRLWARNHRSFLQRWFVPRRRVNLRLGLGRWLMFPLLMVVVVASVVLTIAVLIGQQQFGITVAIVLPVLLVAVATWYHLVNQITDRVHHLIEAAEQAASGDLTIRVSDEHDDELGQLAASFNEMVGNLDHLQRSRQLLSRTMSPNVRQSLIETGLDFRGIVKTVSVLFIDIRDFTKLTERHNTEQLVIFLNDYYTTIANQVHIEGGIIGKYGGDSILAYFGAPDTQSPQESAVAAMLTAMALQEAIQKLSERWQFLGMPPIRVGIGITIGPVVAGPIGSEDQFEYTVIGDSVNLASRLQNLTRNIDGFDVILSKEVYDAMDDTLKQQIRLTGLDEFRGRTPDEHRRHLVEFVDLGEVLVKGKAEPVQVYALPSLENAPINSPSSSV